MATGGPGDLGEPPGVSEETRGEVASSQPAPGSESHEVETHAPHAKREQAAACPSDQPRNDDAGNRLSSGAPNAPANPYGSRVHADSDRPREATHIEPARFQSRPRAELSSPGNAATGRCEGSRHHSAQVLEQHERRLQLLARYQRHQTRVVASSRAVETELLTLCGETKKKAPHVKEAAERALLHIQDFRDKAEASIETLSRAASSASSFAEEAAAAEAAEAIFRSFPVKEVLLVASHAVRTHSSKISLLALSLLQRLLTSHQRQLLLLPCAPEDSLLLPWPTPARAHEEEPDDGSDSGTASASRTLPAGVSAPSSRCVGLTASEERADNAACADSARHFTSLDSSSDVGLPVDVWRLREQAEAELAATAASDVLLLLAVLEELLFRHQGDDEHFVQLKVLQTALLLLAPDSSVAADASVAHRLLRLFFSLYRQASGGASPLALVVSSVSSPADPRLFAGNGAQTLAAGSGGGAHSSAVSHTACAAMTQLAACLVDAAGRALNAQRIRDRRWRGGTRDAVGKTDDGAEGTEAVGPRALIASASDALQTASWTRPLEELLAVPSLAGAAEGLHAPLGDLNPQQRAKPQGADEGGDALEEGCGFQEEAHEAADRAERRAPSQQWSSEEERPPRWSVETPGAVATLEQLLTQLCANCRGISSGALSERTDISSSFCSPGKEAPGGGQRENGDEAEPSAFQETLAQSASSHGAQTAAQSCEAVQGGRSESSSWSPFSRPTFSFFSSPGRGGSGTARGEDKESSRENRRRSSSRPVATDFLLLHLPRGVAVHLLENCMRRGGPLFVQHRGLMRILKQEICPALRELLLHHAYEFVTLVRALRVFIFVARQFGPFLLDELQTLLPAILRRTEADAPLWQRVVALETIKEICGRPALLLLLHAGGREQCWGGQTRPRFSSRASASSLEGEDEHGEARKTKMVPAAERGPEDESIVTALVEALGKTVHQLCFVGSFDSQARLLSTLDLVQPPYLSPLILPVLLPADAVLLLLSALPNALEPCPPSRSAAQEGARFLASTGCFDLSAGRYAVSPSPLSGAACAAAVCAWSALCREEDEARPHVSRAEGQRSEGKKLRRKDRVFRWDFKTASKKPKDRNTRLLDKASDLASACDGPSATKSQSTSFSQQLHASIAVGLALDGLLNIVESLCLLSFSPDAPTTSLGPESRAPTRARLKNSEREQQGSEEEAKREGEVGEDSRERRERRSADQEASGREGGVCEVPWSDALLLPQQQYLPLPLTRHQAICRTILGAAWGPILSAVTLIFSAISSPSCEAPNASAPDAPSPLHLLPLMQCLHNLVCLSCVFRLEAARLALVLCLARFALPFSAEGRASSQASSSSTAKAGFSSSGHVSENGGSAGFADVASPASSHARKTHPFWPMPPGFSLGGFFAPSSRPASLSSSFPLASSGAGGASAAAEGAEGDRFLRRGSAAVGAPPGPQGLSASRREDETLLASSPLSSLSLSCFTSLLSICGYFGNILGTRSWAAALRALQELHALLQLRGLLGPPLALADLQPRTMPTAGSEADDEERRQAAARGPAPLSPSEIVALLEMLQQLQGGGLNPAREEKESRAARAEGLDGDLMREVFHFMKKKQRAQCAPGVSSCPSVSARSGAAAPRSLQALTLCVKVRLTAVAAAATEQGPGLLMETSHEPPFSAPISPETLAARPSASTGTAPTSDAAAGARLVAAPPGELSLQQFNQDVLLRLAASLELLFDFFPLSLSDEGLDALVAALGRLALQQPLDPHAPSGTPPERAQSAQADPPALTSDLPASPLSGPPSSPLPSSLSSPLFAASTAPRVGQTFRLPEAAGAPHASGSTAPREIVYSLPSSSASSWAYFESSWAGAEARSEEEDIQSFPLGRLVELCFFNLHRPCFPRLAQGLLAPLVSLATASRAKSDAQVGAVSALCIALELLLPALRCRSRARLRWTPSARSPETQKPPTGPERTQELTERRTGAARGAAAGASLEGRLGDADGVNGERDGETRGEASPSWILCREYFLARLGVFAGDAEGEGNAVRSQIREEDEEDQLALLAPLCSLLIAAFPGSRLRAMLALHRLLTRRGDCLLPRGWACIFSALGTATELQLGGAYQRVLRRLAALTAEESVTGAREGARDAEKTTQEGNEVEAREGRTEIEGRGGLGLEREIKALFALFELLVQDFVEDVPLSPGWRTLAASIAAFARCSSLGSSMAFRAVGFLWSLADALGRRQRWTDSSEKRGATSRPPGAAHAAEEREGEPMHEERNGSCDGSAGEDGREKGVARGSARVEPCERAPASAVSPPASPRWSSERGVSIESLWTELFLLLRLLAIDPRPEVRNCALRSLTSAVRTHGLSPAPPRGQGEETGDRQESGPTPVKAAAQTRGKAAATTEIASKAEADSWDLRSGAEPDREEDARRPRDEKRDWSWERCVLDIVVATLSDVHSAYTRVRVTVQRERREAQEGDSTGTGRVDVGVEAVASAACRLLLLVQEALLSPHSAAEILVAAAKTLADILKLPQARVELSSLRSVSGGLGRGGELSNAPQSVWSFGWEIYWRFVLHLLSPVPPSAELTSTPSSVSLSVSLPNGDGASLPSSSAPVVGVRQMREAIPDRLVEVLTTKMHEVLEASSACVGAKRGWYSARDLERRKADVDGSLSLSRPESVAPGGSAATNQRERDGLGKKAAPEKKALEAEGRPVPVSKDAGDAAGAERDEDLFPLLESVVAFQLYLVLLTNPAYIRRYGRRIDGALDGLLSQAGEGERRVEAGSKVIAAPKDARRAETPGCRFSSPQEGVARGAFDKAAAEASGTADFECEAEPADESDGSFAANGGEGVDLLSTLCRGRSQPSLPLSRPGGCALPSSLVLSVLNFARTAPSPALSLPLCSSSPHLSSPTCGLFPTPPLFAALLASTELQKASLHSLVTALPVYVGSAPQRGAEPSGHRAPVVQASESFREASVHGYPASGEDVSGSPTSPWAVSAVSRNPFQSGQQEEQEVGQAEGAELGVPDEEAKNPFSPSVSDRQAASWARPSAERRGDSQGPPCGGSTGRGVPRQPGDRPRAPVHALESATAIGEETSAQDGLLLLDGVRERLALSPFLPPLRSSVALLAALLQRRKTGDGEREERQKQEDAGEEPAGRDAGTRRERGEEGEGAPSESDCDACGRGGAADTPKEDATRDQEEVKRLLAETADVRRQRALEDALQRLLRHQPIVSAVRISTAQAPLLEALMDVCPSPVDNPAAFSQLFPLFLSELGETFLRPPALFRDAASLAVGCRVLLELQLFFRASFVSLLWQDFARMRKFLCASLAAPSPAGRSGEGRNGEAAGREDAGREAQLEPDEAWKGAEANGATRETEHVAQEGRRGGGGEKVRREREKARTKPERRLFARSGSISSHRPQQVAVLCQYATATGIQIATPQPTLKCLQSEARGDCRRRSEGSWREGEGPQGDTRQQVGRSQEEQSPQRDEGNAAGGAEGEEDESKAENDSGKEEKGSDKRGESDGKDARVGLAGRNTEETRAPVLACACRSRPCLQCTCEHSPTAVLLRSLARLLNALVSIASSRASPALDRLQVWKVSLQTACVLIEDASCFLSHRSWLSPSPAAAACPPHCPAFESHGENASRDVGKSFWTAATHALRRMLLTLSTPPPPASPFAPSGSPFSPSAQAKGAEASSEGGRHRGARTRTDGAETGSAAALPSAFFFDRWILRIAAETLARPAPRHEPSARFYPFFVSVLDHYCSAGSERPAVIAHEAFCTLFDLSEDRFSRLDASLSPCPSLSASGDCASTRTRMQSVLPLVLRRCRAILQRFANPVPVGGEAGRASDRRGAGDLALGRSSPGAWTVPSALSRNPLQACGRSQLLLFVLSRLRSLRTSPLAFEAGEDEKAGEVSASAFEESGSRARLAGDPEGDDAEAVSLRVSTPQRRLTILRASGSKAHLLLLLPQLIACIGCDDRSVRREIQAALGSLCSELGIEEEASLGRLAACAAGVAAPGAKAGQ
ncbi:hypothetical protein NCLIV_020530 [Neospora caninum Liverpool]|uniref:Mon2/Sec7/BIG1-like HUS domain-containing protein n=1 Tax=Neospora caninum (strain Liverpool) TaxID=572307 RepID=F0VEX2_NEOCL|nr:hypothetical protein NCLIV_020530 [Neospora caninum Liverpool]CBZ52266.1 hypothetical protein NCLIV_020530 [Neospora caninum Liverpool]|eukprot:XP_003882298.1 hypothetical protein NCLIV_020530 [Neospora caninum Liverpool]